MFVRMFGLGVEVFGQFRVGSKIEHFLVNRRVGFDRLAAANFLAALTFIGSLGAVVSGDDLLDRFEDFLDRRFTVLSH
jgi:hypothetical protein